MSEAEIDRARLRTVRAKARLTAALTALKARLMPRAIARNLFNATTEKAADAAEAGVEAVKARPAVLAGAVGLAALFLARKPIARTLSRKAKETPTPPARSPVKRAPSKPPRARSTRKAKP